MSKEKKGNKETRKQAVLTPKEKKQVKRDKKNTPKSGLP